MSNEWTFFPNAMTAHDLKVMRDAMRLAEGDTSDEAQKQRLPGIVFRYYRKGMTDAERLAAIALFLSSSRTFATRQSEFG